MEELQKIKIPIAKIKVPSVRVTAEFDKERLAYLRSSIETGGFIDPILVRPLENGEYELIDGLHRIEVLNERGIQEVEALVKPMEEKESMILNVATSVAKGKTNPVEVGKVLAELVQRGENPESLAGRFGKNIRWINLYLTIGQMEPKYQDGLVRGKLSVGVIEAALSLEDDNEINQALDYAMIYNYTIPEMERYVENRKKDIEKYQEWTEKMGYAEVSKPDTKPEMAYLTKCSGCQQNVDSRFIRGGAFCKTCLYLISMVYDNLGAPEKSLPILETIIREHHEREMYEQLKAKYEKKEPEQNVTLQ